jgi:uncharacterized membrane protein
MTRASLRRLLDRLQSSYWFIPLVMAILGFLLARLMYQVDLRIPGTRLSTQEFIYSGSAEGARTILLGLAGSILATAGVVYSLLTVPFSLVASQYGSRLLRLLLRDTTIQLVLGLFVGSFAYLLTVALAIPPATAEPTTPHLSISLGLYLSLACFGSLILLIHHIGVALQAPHMAAAANSELQAVLKEVIPISRRQSVRQPDDADVLIAGRIEREGDPIYAELQGYIQALDADLIRPLARKNNLVVRLVRKPGHFVQRGELVALVWPPRNIGPGIMANIRDSYQVGTSRTPTQDLEYGFNQLVEMAVRAMSPAINDPFTAMTCLDYIGAGLSVYAAEFEPITNVYDDSGHLRLIMDPQSFAQVLDAALNMIRQASRNNPEVLLHMLDALEEVGKRTPFPEQRAEILRHVNLVGDENQAGDAVRGDKERVDRRCAELAAALAAPMG